MSAGSECKYVHDVSGQRFDDLGTDEWDCPHPAPDGKYCPFHSEKSERGPVLNDLLVEYVTNESNRQNRFIGASIDSLSLDYLSIQSENNHPIDLRETKVSGDISCIRSSISQSLLIQGATVEGTIRLDESTFGGRVMMTDSSIAELQCEEGIFERRFDVGRVHIQGNFNARLSSFKSWVDMREAEIVGESHFRNARFYKGIYGEGAVFETSPDFFNSTFDKVGNFKGAVFHRGANFGGVDFFNSVDFRGAHFLNEIEFQASQATGEVAEHRARFDGVGWFDGMEVQHDARFQDTVIGGDMSLRDIVVNGSFGIDTDPTHPASAEDVHIDLSKSEIAEGEITHPVGGSQSYDFTDATIGDIKFKGEDPFSNILVLNTTFDGFDFSTESHRKSLADNEWKLHDTEDPPSPSELENIYLKAKNGASEVGAGKASAEFFREELNSRRKHHKHMFLETDSYRSKVRYAGRYISNTLLGSTSGYGERPSYVITWSIAIVAVFSVIYAVIADGSWLEHILFSFQSFISFIVGPPLAQALIVRVFSSVQGFLGAFLIALFVFTLTRSVHR